MTPAVSHALCRDLEAWARAVVGLAASLGRLNRRDRSDHERRELAINLADILAEGDSLLDRLSDPEAEPEMEA